MMPEIKLHHDGDQCSMFSSKMPDSSEVRILNICCVFTFISFTQTKIC